MIVFRIFSSYIWANDLKINLSNNSNFSPRTSVKIFTALYLQQISGNTRTHNGPWRWSLIVNSSQCKLPNSETSHTRGVPSLFALVQPCVTNENYRFVTLLSRFTCVHLVHCVCTQRPWTRPWSGQELRQIKGPVSSSPCRWLVQMFSYVLQFQTAKISPCSVSIGVN